LNVYKIKYCFKKTKRYIRFGIVFYVFLLIGVKAPAQSVKSENPIPKDSLFFAEQNSGSSHQQLDLKDIVKDLFELRHHQNPPIANDSSFVIQSLSPPALHAKNDVPQSGKLLFAIFPAVGYTLQTGTTAIVAMNMAFFNGTSDSTNLSTIAINPIMSLQYKQYLLNIISNVWSKKNKFDFLGDWRYYKYPTYTYGLGGHSSVADADLVDYSYIRIYQEALKQINSSKFYTGFGYNLDYHFGIAEKTDATETDFKLYNGSAQTTVSSGLSYNLLYDSRKNSNYAEDATFFNITYRYNSKYLGSDQNWQSVYLEFKKYIKLSPNSHNVLAFWNLDWFSFGGKPPYFDLPSTGWDSYSNTGRGYIQSRLRGPAMLYLESEYRFRLTKNGLFGGVVFANAQSVSELGSNKFETILPGTGLGLRIKLNKISGANLSIDYGFGTHGSQGLFFNISEVF
jgi:hypothetical protein